MTQKRIDGRTAEELRPMTIVPGVSPYAEGSAEVTCGKTKLLITATVETDVPPWMKEGQGGWITAEYGMLPRATHTRNKREASQGKQSGRTLEIQRLIGRALRAALNIRALPGLTLRLDCDVLCADGGTRTAAISGAWVALYQAIKSAKSRGLLDPNFPVKNVAAISVGIVGGVPLVDLCYEEDSQADFDLNVVLDHKLQIVEVQGTAEKDSVPAPVLGELLVKATKAISSIMEKQQAVIASL